MYQHLYQAGHDKFAKPLLERLNAGIFSCRCKLFGNLRMVRSPERFAATVAQIYQNKADWLTVRDAGIRALENGFCYRDHAPVFIKRIENVAANLDEHRNRNI